MRQWKRLQDEAPQGTKLFFSIVDLHAITMPQDAPVLRQRSREMMASLLAIGLDPTKSTIFYQSSIPAHSELMWILNCTASVGYLNRMTQWKSKLAEDNNALRISDETIETKLKAGLFTYPVLQAADILIHRATHVPVGDDQRQHLEFARECATNFNHAYPGGDLVAPQTITKNVQVHAQPPLAHPHHVRGGRDPPGASAAPSPTPSAPSRTTPGTGPASRTCWTCCPSATPRGASRRSGPATFSAAGAGNADLKQAAADAVVRELAGVRERYADFLGRKGGRWLEEIEEEGAEAARESAAETMRMVRDVVGLKHL
ncbi:hypothetical protein PG994_009359 [Apiospora phragmitis]|uniref:tryptophan--tRNA ligase n=1 Tax=Apiospora phragmitis TaxID=2905665 RepID=A0ABR1ULD4_9PEZI